MHLENHHHSKVVDSKFWLKQSKRLHVQSNFENSSCLHLTVGAWSSPTEDIFVTRLLMKVTTPHWAFLLYFLIILFLEDRCESLLSTDIKNVPVALYLTPQWRLNDVRVQKVDFMDFQWKRGKLSNFTEKEKKRKKQRFWLFLIIC